jgi:GcrA cell cycle regulator
MPSPNPLTPNPGWTDARVGELKRRWIAGESASFIAKALGGVSRCAVIAKVYRLGMTSDYRAPVSAPGTRERALICQLEAKPPADRTPKPTPKTSKVTAPHTSLMPVSVRVSSDGRRLYQLPPSVALPQTPPSNTGLGKPWLEREPGECNWPVSGEGADTRYCCQPILKGSWCKSHHKSGHQPATGWFSDKAIAKVVQKASAA